MRLLLNYTIALSIVYSLPVPVYAKDPFMDGAKEAVEEQKKAADLFADQLVQYSFQQTMDNLLGTVAELKQIAERSAALHLATEQLEQEMLTFARQDAVTAAKSKTEMERALRTYSSLYRRMIDLSFTPTSLTAIQAQMPKVMQLIVQEFENMCTIGKAHVDFSAALPAAPPPPTYKFLWDIYGSTDYQNTKGNYSSLNYRHKDRENALKNAAGATGASFMIAANLALAGGSAAAIGVAAAAGGIGLVVVAVLAAISYFSGEAKAYKMMTKYVNAELYKHRNVPRSQYIAMRYREGCQSMLTILKDVDNTVSLFLSGPNGARQILESTRAREAELKATEEQFSRANEAKCRIQLASTYNKEKKTSNDICQITIGANGKPDVSNDEKFLNKLRDEKFFETHMTTYVTKAISRSLTTDVENFRSNISEITFQPIYNAQARAFSKLMAIVNSHQQLLDEKDPASMQVLAELRLTEKFEKLNSRFTSLMSMAIRMIFEKVTAEEFSLQRAGFEKDLQQFIADNPGLIAGNRLKSRLSNLLRIVNER